MCPAGLCHGRRREVPVYMVRELLRTKGPAVHTIGPASTVLDAAKKMNEHRIGCLVVVDGGRVVGIFTERDILTKVVAGGMPPASTPVSEVMTARVLTCTPQTAFDEVRRTMREKRIRHMPVVEDGRLAGLVSLGDLNVAEAQTLTETIDYLAAYIAS